MAPVTDARKINPHLDENLPSDYPAFRFRAVEDGDPDDAHIAGFVSRKFASADEEQSSADERIDEGKEPFAWFNNPKLTPDKPKAVEVEGELIEKFNALTTAYNELASKAASLEASNTELLGKLATAEAALAEATGDSGSKGKGKK